MKIEYPNNTDRPTPLGFVSTSGSVIIYGEEEDLVFMAGSFCFSEKSERELYGVSHHLYGGDEIKITL